jgi:ketosteroid isomerase-like protein
MSAEDLEILREALAILEERFDTDALVGYYHPDINYRAVEGAPDDIGEFTGHEAMRTYHQQWVDTFDNFRVESQELIDHGDVVIAVLRLVGRMRGSEAEVDLRFAIVYELRDGLIYKAREYWTKEEALAAAEAW